MIRLARIAAVAGAIALGTLTAGQAAAATTPGPDANAAPAASHVLHGVTPRAGGTYTVRHWVVRRTDTSAHTAGPAKGAPKKHNAISGNTNNNPDVATWDGVTRHITTAGVVDLTLNDSTSGGFCGLYVNSAGNGYGSCWGSGQYGTHRLWSYAPTGVYYFYASQRASGSNHHYGGSLYY